MMTHAVALAEDGALAPIEAKAAEAPSAAPAPARTRVPIRVVRVLRGTNQALLYDRTGGGTHLLVAVGEQVGIYTVESIDEDEVTLSANGQQVVLAAPDRSWRRRGGASGDPSRAARGDAAGERPRAVSSDAPAPSPSPTPADPYGAPADPYRAPADPYRAPADPYGAPADPYRAPADPYGAPADPYPGSEAGAPRPADPYAEEIREVRAPSWLEPAAPARAPALAPSAAPAPGPAPVAPALPVPAPSAAPGLAPSAAPAPTIGSTPSSPPGADPVLSRREVDAALADFGALAVAFRASFTPEGVKVVSILDGSMLSKAGLRAGDLIASVDGQPLRSLDDVAALYARAGSLRAVTAQVVRGGKPLSLRVLIQ